jgi:NADH:ubiquinone oxidoreductase subunit 6 (subunit J)
MYAELEAVLLSAGLLATVGFALFSSKVSTSLISLFYSSVLLALVFAFFGDAFLGVVQMTTFAGAVTVLTLTVILLTGESRLGLGAKRAWIAGGALVATVAAVAFVFLAGTPATPGASYPDLSTQLFSFLWEYRPWDLLILMMAFASAMITITNLLSGDA